MPLKPSIKSLILTGLIIVINFATYLSFRFIGFSELNFIEGLIFTTYESFVHILIITPISFLFFKLNSRK